MKDYKLIRTNCSTVHCTVYNVYVRVYPWPPLASEKFLKLKEAMVYQSM